MQNETKRKPFSEKRGKNIFGISVDLPRVIEVDLNKLKPNPNQPRSTFNEETLQELASSIAQVGLIQPIAVVRDQDDQDCFIIVAGERRKRAFEILGKTTIPSIITSGSIDEIALIENIQRENLHPLDEANAIAKLMENYQYSQVAVAKAIGKSRPTVNELLRLTSLPDTIQSVCRALDTPKTTLVAISKIEDKEQQFLVWEQAKTHGMTSRIARAKKKKSAPPKTETRYSDDAAKILNAGKKFIEKLQTAASSNEIFDNETVTDLVHQGDIIKNLLEEIVKRNI
jgi:ParB family chromosome partitioning protein